MDEERQKMRKEQEKRVKEEQRMILGKNNSRPKLSFSLKPWRVCVMGLVATIASRSKKIRRHVFICLFCTVEVNQIADIHSHISLAVSITKR